MNTIFIIKIFKGTPWWVWIVFTYLLYIGFKSMRKRTVYLPNLFIMPIILFALKSKVFFGGNSVLMMIYFVALLLGMCIGFIHAKKTMITCLQERIFVQIPGNYHTLTILILFFSMKYFFGYLQATAPEIVLKYLWFEIFLSALCSGYFLGRAVNYVRRCFQGISKEI